MRLISNRYRRSSSIHTISRLFLLLVSSGRVATSSRFSTSLSNNLDYCSSGASNISASNDDDEEDVVGTLMPCSSLDEQWVECEAVTDTRNGNGTNEPICTHFGVTNSGHFHYANVTCSAYPCIECSGSRTFIRSHLCIKYTGHYFLTAMLYSVFLGALAVDRFYLGYSALAVGKLMTLGGLGIWWMLDIVLLLNGTLMPADESEWQPYYFNQERQAQARQSQLLPPAAR